MDATFRRSVMKIAAILAGGMRCAVWKRRQNAAGERVREQSFAPPDGRGRQSRDFWWSLSLERASLRWTDGGVRPYVILVVSFVRPHVVFGVAMLGAHGGWG